MGRGKKCIKVCHSGGFVTLRHNFLTESENFSFRPALRPFGIE